MLGGFLGHQTAFCIQVVGSEFRQWQLEKRLGQNPVGLVSSMNNRVERSTYLLSRVSLYVRPPSGCPNLLDFYRARIHCLSVFSFIYLFHMGFWSINLDLKPRQVSVFGWIFCPVWSLSIYTWIEFRPSKNH